MEEKKVEHQPGSRSSELSQELVKNARIDSGHVTTCLALFSACMVAAHDDAPSAILLYQSIIVYPNWAKREYPLE